MPTVNATLTAPGTVEQVFQVLTDPSFLAATIPGVRSMQSVSPTQAVWKVEVRQGLLRRELTFDVTHTPVPPHQVSFVAVAKEVRIEGTLRLNAEGAGRTAVVLALTYEGQGPLRYIINNLVAKSMQDYPADFEGQLAGRLAAGPGDRPPAPPGGGHGAAP